MAGNFQFSSPEGSGIRQVGETFGQRQAVLDGVEDRKAGMLPSTELWPETSSFPLPKGAIAGKLGKSLDRGRQSSTESRTGKQGCSRPRGCGRKLPVFLSRRERYQADWENRWTEAGSPLRSRGQESRDAPGHGVVAGNFQFSSPEGSGSRQVGEIVGQKQAVLDGFEDRKAGMLPATELWPETSSFPLPKGAIAGRLGKPLDRGRRSSPESRTGKQGCSRPRSLNYRADIRIAFSFSTFSSQVSHSMPLEEGCFPSSYSSSHAETASARDSGSRPLK